VAEEAIGSAVELDELIATIPARPKRGSPARVEVRLNDWRGLNVDVRLWMPEEGVFRPSGQGVRVHSREALEALRDALTDVLQRDLDFTLD
jgi:hypothetical protein